MHYNAFMKTAPIPIRLEDDLQAILQEGARRTPHKKQELIRITLRRHLRDVIDEESITANPPRVTNIDPWPRAVVERAYRRMGKEWDKIEDAAVRAQGKPDFND